MTMADIQKQIYPILVRQPCPRSLKNFYDKITSSNESFKQLEYKMYFVALCHLATAKGIRMQPIYTKFNELVDYTMILADD